jgi:hypothetical protein
MVEFLVAAMHNNCPWYLYKRACLGLPLNVRACPQHYKLRLVVCHGMPWWVSLVACHGMPRWMSWLALLVGNTFQILFLGWNVLDNIFLHIIGIRYGRRIYEIL